MWIQLCGLIVNIKHKTNLYRYTKTIAGASWRFLGLSEKFPFFLLTNQIQPVSHVNLVIARNTTDALLLFEADRGCSIGRKKHVWLTHASARPQGHVQGRPLSVFPPQLAPHYLYRALPHNYAIEPAATPISPFYASKAGFLGLWDSGCRTASSILDGGVQI